MLWSLLNIRMNGRWLCLRVSVACSYGFRIGRDILGDGCPMEYSTRDSLQQKLVCLICVVS